MKATGVLTSRKVTELDLVKLYYILEQNQDIYKVKSLLAGSSWTHLLSLVGLDSIAANSDTSIAKGFGRTNGSKASAVKQ